MQSEFPVFTFQSLSFFRSIPRSHRHPLSLSLSLSLSLLSLSLSLSLSRLSLTLSPSHSFAPSISISLSLPHSLPHFSAGLDYDPRNRTIIIKPGHEHGCTHLQLHNDYLREELYETFGLLLSPTQQRVFVNRSHAQVVIKDTDGKCSSDWCSMTPIQSVC